MWVFFVFLGGVIFFGVLWVRLSGCFLDDGLGEVVVFECVGDGDCDFVVLERLNGIFWFFFFFLWFGEGRFLGFGEICLVFMDWLKGN